MLGKKGPKIEIAVIGGWLACELMSSGALEGERRDRIDTPFGASQPLFLMATDHTPFYFLSRHGERSYTGSSFVNYRANIYALKELGVKTILAWSGCGAITDDFEIGQWVVPDDVIDETRRREGTFMQFSGIGLTRQRDPFCPTIRRELINVLSGRKADFFDHGVYVCTEGPRLETAAEVRKYRGFGGNLLGMTLVPEVFLARELEMCYAALGIVTNYAEGIKDRRFQAGETFEGLSTRAEQLAVERSMTRIPEILRDTVDALQGVRQICHCRESMKRFKKLGQIGEDWHEWLKPQGS
jgi:5'-methylthioadenosine phosphorylase